MDVRTKFLLNSSVSVSQSSEYLSYSSYMGFKLSPADIAERMGQ